MRTLTADKIKKLALRDILPGYYDFKTTEFAPYHTDVRFDVIGIKRATRMSRIVEVKSCRADFLSDHKWEKYLPFATHFYFAAPKGAIRIDELPPGVGLAEVKEFPNGHMALEYTKKCKRLPGLSDDTYMRLIEGAFVRLKFELEATQAGEGQS